VELAVDADEHLVQMPTPLRPGLQMPRPLATDLGRKDRTADNSSPSCDVEATKLLTGSVLEFLDCV
jgi:hypothetical protein